MKRIYIIITLLLVAAVQVKAQGDFASTIADAKSSYKAGNLEEARFALQQSLAEVDREIGKEILKMLPTSLAGLDYIEQGDDVSGGTSAFGGLFVHREYGDTLKSVNIDLMDNSPMLAGINALLAMPMIMNNADGSQKVIKVSGYKALLQRQDSGEGEITGYSIQIPFNQSLFTVNFDGAFTENEATAAANSLPVSEVSKLSY